MQRASAGTLALVVALVICGCGNDGGPESGGSGAGSGGSEQGVGGGSGGAVGGGGDSGGAVGSGGDSGGAVGGGEGGAPTKCQVIDGDLEYGPIGEPQPLPIEPSSADSATCIPVGGVFGFRTAEGYGFVWGTKSDSNTPSWTLYGMSVDLDFGGGNPQVLRTKDSAPSLDVIPASDGYLLATCSEDSEAEWMWLDSDFEIVQEKSPITPAAPCNYRQPSILWTGEYYLTYFVDARGLVVASLDEQGDIVREEVLSESQASVAEARFSKNGDRVLVASVRSSEGLARYGVFDLEGRLMGDTQRLGEEEAHPTSVAIATSEDGWLVLSDYSVVNEGGVRLTHISKDGLVSREQQLWSYYHAEVGIAPSTCGGFLYLGRSYTGGQYGAESRVIGLIDGERGSGYRSAYYEEQNLDTIELWPLSVVNDPQRDLIVKASLLDDSCGMVFVQEYGWWGGAKEE